MIASDLDDEPGPNFIESLAGLSADQIKDGLRRIRAAQGLGAPPLWPAPYNEDTPEAAWAFVQQCETKEETSSQILKMPTHDYLRLIVWEWFDTRRTGQPLLFNKSRRLVVSWLLCALDVWDAGIRRCNIVEGGADYNKATDFVWRCWFIYEQLRLKWSKLPKMDKFGNEKSERLDKLMFPNGSIIEPLNSDGESFRGSGYTRVKLEELSSYRYVGQVLSQAGAVTQGLPGLPGGHIVGVSNAHSNIEWQEAIEPTEPLKPDHYQAYTSKGGNRVLRIHYRADPSKDDAWSAAERIRGAWNSREWLREMELQDKIAQGALWTQEVIDQNRVWDIPMDKVVNILVGVDPSVADPELAKNPSKKPDECGIVTIAVTDDYHAYVLEDCSGVMSPTQWGQAVNMTFTKNRASSVIAEGNQGSDLVRINLQLIRPIPVKIVHARIGKRARAEPVSTAYEQGQVHHVGYLNDLEMQMTGHDFSRPIKSPGRIDALVWAITGSGILDMLSGGVMNRFRNLEIDEDEIKMQHMGGETLVPTMSDFMEAMPPEGYPAFGFTGNGFVVGGFDN